MLNDFVNTRSTIQLLKEMVFCEAIKPEQRALVLFLKNETNNYSQRKIASIVKISKSSVFDVLKRKKTGKRKFPKRLRKYGVKLAVLQMIVTKED